MDLTEFRTRFRLLRDKGFVKSRRRGPTGAGKTLEDLLGMTENNIALPDLPFAELKAHRANSSSMITLFTFNNKAWMMDPLEAVRSYGTIDAKGRLGMYFTTSGTPNSEGLFVRFESASVDLRHVGGTLVASWSVEGLTEAYERAAPAVVYVTAEVERRETEYFYYCRARTLVGISRPAVTQFLREGQIPVDIRMGARSTGSIEFRTSDDCLPTLYRSVRDV